SVHGHQSSLAMVGCCLDRFDGTSDDEVRSETSQLRAGSARVAVNAGAPAGDLIGLAWGLRPHEARGKRQRERSIEQPAVVAEIFDAIAASLREVAKPERRSAVILRNRMSAHRLGLPFTIQLCGDGLLRRLSRSVVSKKRDVAKAVQPEALRRRFERALKD